LSKAERHALRGSKGPWLTATLLLAVSSFAAAAPPASPLETVTIEAQRKKKEIEQQVGHFVSSVPRRYLDDSLSRWNIRICPLVGGLTHDQGEFFLARLSQIARDAGAPLAGAKCSPNLYVIATREPDDLLKKWYARDRHMFVTRNGMGYVRDFFASHRPIRVWYNTDFTSDDGAPSISAGLSAALVGTTLQMGFGLDDVPTNTVQMATRLQRSAVQTFSSVVVIVDANQIGDLNFGQLADYVGMLALAEINLDVDVSTMPTILRLFRDRASPPQALTELDKAFLFALYSVKQASTAQAPLMRASMVQHVAP
jgi:hypothetical protein